MAYCTDTISEIALIDGNKVPAMMAKGPVAGQLLMLRCDAYGRLMGAYDVSSMTVLNVTATAGGAYVASASTAGIYFFCRNKGAANAVTLQFDGAGGTITIDPLDALSERLPFSSISFTGVSGNTELDIVIGE